jgi:hypothetical protein
MKKTFAWLWPALLLMTSLLTGCSTTITNLTPGTQQRKPNGLYPFEVALDTSKQSIQQETLKPYVLISGQVYPMQPTLSLKNRWETLVPIPANREYVSYQFKFDYQYRSIPTAQPGSKLSQAFQLHILDK